MKPTALRLRLIFIAIVFGIAAFLAGQVNAQVSGNIQLVASESKLWIEGSSTVHDFNCEAGHIVAYANIGQPNVETLEDGTTISNDNGSVTLDIPVYDFDCGRNRMNRDFYGALRAEDHPSINFEYYSSRLITNIGPYCHPFQLKVKGRLSVAGNGQDIEVLVDIEPCEENRFLLTGSKVINMLDFGIEPPSAMMGLIRANEELKVFFSLTAEQTPEEE
ncbi:MAG: hypothetical protein LAT84_09035 [Balneolia bacterium]|nr:hypothetical protein [Balneolia bacterium]